jgi:hypothetical protein
MRIDIVRSFLVVDQAVPIADPAPNKNAPIAARLVRLAPRATSS